VAGGGGGSSDGHLGAQHLGRARIGTGCMPLRYHIPYPLFLLAHIYIRKYICTYIHTYTH
jgi:hypothetical protein